MASNQLRRVSSRFVSARVRCLEVPVECGSVKSGLVDFVRVQECFTTETKYGTCKLASLIETDTDVSPAVIQEKAKAATCVKNISSPDFCREHCSERWCHFHKMNHLYTLDAVITCVEIKISVSDFHSAHGHNFVGTATTMRCPQSYIRRSKERYPKILASCSIMTVRVSAESERRRSVSHKFFRKAHKNG